MIPTVKRFFVGDWNAIRDKYNAVGSWFSEIEVPIGLAGVFAFFTGVAVVREINQSCHQVFVIVEIV